MKSFRCKIIDFCLNQEYEKYTQIKFESTCKRDFLLLVVINVVV